MHLQVAEERCPAISGQWDKTGQTRLGSVFHRRVWSFLFLLSSFAVILDEKYMYVETMPQGGLPYVLSPLTEK